MTKIRVFKQRVDRLQPQGYLFIGHSESLKGIYEGLKTVMPTVYHKIKMSKIDKGDNKVKQITLSVGFLYLCLFSFSSAVFADSIVPDRPGFSTGTYTVEPNMVHLEFGLQADYGNAGEADSFTAPLLNVRVGITDSTELNILLDGVTRESGSGTESTTSDMLVGAKHRLLVSEQYNLSVLGFISLATGNSPDSGHSTPFLGLLWDYTLSSNISAFGTLQFISFVEDEERSNNFQPALGLSFSHTDTVSTFIEYYRDMSLNVSGPSSDNVDAGIAYLITQDTQLDFNFGISLDGVSSDYVGVGYAVRF